MKTCSSHCVVPENVHTPPPNRRVWKFQRGGLLKCQSITPADLHLSGWSHATNYWYSCLQTIYFICVLENIYTSLREVSLVWTLLPLPFEHICLWDSLEISNALPLGEGVGGILAKSAKSLPALISASYMQASTYNISHVWCKRIQTLNLYFLFPTAPWVWNIIKTKGKEWVHIVTYILWCVQAESKRYL